MDSTTPATNHDDLGNAKDGVRCSAWVCEHERRAAAYGLTLATLCDLVLGEDAQDRSDDALVRAVSKLVRASSQTHRLDHTSQ